MLIETGPSVSRARTDRHGQKACISRTRLCRPRYQRRSILGCARTARKEGCLCRWVRPSWAVSMVIGPRSRRERRPTPSNQTIHRPRSRGNRSEYSRSATGSAGPCSWLESRCSPWRGRPWAVRVCCGDRSWDGPAAATPDCRKRESRRAQRRTQNRDRRYLDGHGAWPNEEPAGAPCPASVDPRIGATARGP